MSGLIRRLFYHFGVPQSGKLRELKKVRNRQIRLIVLTLSQWFFAHRSLQAVVSFETVNLMTLVRIQS